MEKNGKMGLFTTYNTIKSKPDKWWWAYEIIEESKTNVSSKQLKLKELVELGWIEK